MRTEAEGEPSPGDAVGSGPTDHAEGRGLVLRAIRFGLLGFLGLRLATALIGVVGVALFPALDPVGVPGWPAPGHDPGWHNAFAAWERFDALWFLRIAEGGYRLEDGSAAFFPLYPLAIRAVTLALGGHPFAAATVVSNLAFLGALVVTYVLTTSELSERTARTTVLLLCAFPTAYFFLMPYSESLFLLLAVTALWAARRRRWAIAGAAGAFAALTRSIGVVLVPALLVEALHQREEGRSVWPGLAASVATGIGVTTYLGYWQLRADEWLAPVTRQATWERTFSWPWATLWDATSAAVSYVDGANGGYWLLDWLIVVPMLAASVYAVMRLRPTFGVYLLGGLLLPLSFVFPSRPLMSMPRFLLPLFPAFWGLALALERWRVPRPVVLAACAMGFGILSVLTVNWYYVF